jgi:hypothetical protein
LVVAVPLEEGQRELLVDGGDAQSKESDGLGRRGVTPHVLEDPTEK